MDEPVRLAAAAAVGAAVTWLLVPAVKRLAVRTDFYDCPGGYKEHRRPTPYLGGLAVLAGFFVASIVFADALTDFRVPALCALILLVVGTIDDRVNLGIAPRLIPEIGVAVAVWAVGLGWDLGSSEAFDLLVTIAWVVGVINAYNLMDNLDGAAATVAGTSAAGIGVLAGLQGDPMLAAVCLSLAGACVGFLPHNLARPSRIFLGDGGSMPIGFLLAVAVMAVPQNFTGLPAFAVGCLLVGVPLLDMAAVVVSRRRRGVGIFVGGRDHMTHRLHRYLGSERSVDVALAAGQGSLCVIALVLNEGFGGVTILAVSVAALAAAAAGLAAIEQVGSAVERGRREDM